MWITLDDSDVYAKMSAPEVDAIRTVVLATGQSDPIPDELDRVTAEVRGYVAACARNVPLGKEPTIPSELYDAALAIIVCRVASRLPAAILLTQERENAKRDAIQLLRDVAACRFAIVRPDPNQLSNENVGTLYGSFDPRRCRKFSPDQQNGI